MLAGWDGGWKFLLNVRRVERLGTLRLRDNRDANRKRSISPKVLNLHIRDVVTPRRRTRGLALWLRRENGGQVFCFILIFYRIWSYWKRRILFNKSIY